MNQTQRKFLIDKITQEGKKKIEALKSQKEEKPSLSNHIYKALMENSLKLKTEKEILEVLKKRAVEAKEGSDWLSKSRSAFYNSTAGTVTFDPEDLFVFPESYAELRGKVKEKNSEIEKQIHDIEVHLNTLEMRIQLASDKTLQKMINEIDDMGYLSLIDTKIKQIGNS